MITKSRFLKIGKRIAFNYCHVISKIQLSMSNRFLVISKSIISMLIYQHGRVKTKVLRARAQSSNNIERSLKFQ